MSPVTDGATIGGTAVADVQAISHCCRILGALFYLAADDPQLEPVLEFLRTDELAEVWPFGGDAELAGLHQRFRLALTGRHMSETLAAERQRLFVGPEHLEAPPWGSVYLDAENCLFGPSTSALTDFLAAHGVELQQGINEPCDHIGLEFMAIAQLADQHDARAIRDFMAAHLVPWSGFYLKDLKETTLHPFFPALADLADLTIAGLGEWSTVPV